MIYNALNYVVQQLDHFLKDRFAVQDSKAILGSILNEAGVVPAGNQNKMILTLVNIEHDTTSQYEARPSSIRNVGVTDNLPYNFILDVLMTAVFPNYDEALKYLSETIYFFQVKQIFTHQNAPGLDPGIEKLTFEIIKMDYDEMQNLWTGLGVNYRPSVLFKVGMYSFQSGKIDQINPEISRIDISK